MNKLFDRYFIKQPRLREAVTRAIYGSGDDTVSILGAELSVNTLKENGYFRASRASKRYSLFRDEIPVIQNLSALMDDRTTFIDAGANIGIFSACIARLRGLFDEMDVVAFEVDPDTFRRLSVNANRHIFTAHNIGLGKNHIEACEFVRGAVSHVTTQSTIGNDYSIADRTFFADIRPLSSFDFGENQLVLKIDIEGQELEVLEGASKLLSDNKIKAVYLDGATHMKDIFDLLLAHKFQFFCGRTLKPISEPDFSVLAVREIG